MKMPRFDLIAASIGDDSFSLINYESLSPAASKTKQIEALSQDQRWQEEHHNIISRRIDNLIDRIENEL